MNPLNNFREFLHSGDKQLLDIFEDYGEEKPEPVKLYFYTFLYDYNCNLLPLRDEIEESIEELVFNSQIELKAFLDGAKCVTHYVFKKRSDMVVFSGKNKESLIEEIVSFVRGEYGDGE